MTLPEIPKIYPAQEWMDRAACKGVDTAPFFSEYRVEQNRAKEVCATCTVRTDCLDYAILTNSRFGIFGGMTYRERGRLVTSGYWPGRSADPHAGSRVQA